MTRLKRNYPNYKSPLYAVSKEIIKKYKPFLDEIDLTYTQYITMMVLWEENEILVKEMGERLFLDSGTLTPVLNGLEKKDTHHAGDQKKTKGMYMQ